MADQIVMLKSVGMSNAAMQRTCKAFVSDT